MKYIRTAENNAFHEEVKERFGSHVNMEVNISSIINATGSVYISLMTVIVIAVLILSVIIIIFVLYLLVRTMLNNKKHEYGILKALGFTTGQLILQTALSFMPVIVFAMIIGTIVSCMIINSLMAVFLSGIGIVKCTFVVPVGFITISGIGLVLFAFAMACVLILPRRINSQCYRAILVKCYGFNIL